jgi:hypothetical protein
MVAGLLQAFFTAGGKICTLVGSVSSLELQLLMLSPDAEGVGLLKLLSLAVWVL